jgi:adenylate cyclase
MSPGRPSEASATLRRLRHEMRTALGQILGYSEMLEEDAEDKGVPEMGADLGKIHSSASRLLVLVDQMLSPEARTSGGDEPSGAGREPTEGEAADPEGLPAARASGRLLVVDDTAENRELLERRLARAGYEVTCAVDGEEALHRLETTEFDGVLLDVLMPGIDGFEVLTRIRSTHSTSDLPVIMATALNATEDIVRAFQLGANDFVSKPFEMPVVLARLATHLKMKSTLEKVESLARELQIRNAFIRRTLGRYVSDEIATDILENPDSLQVGGERRGVSILLSDLRGFSTLTETLPATDVLRVLNNYLGAMAEVVHEHGGTIDEFIGDAVLAFFGAPRAGEDDARRAVHCALAMQCAMVGVNERNLALGLPAVELGIGIATGDVIVGNVGSDRRSKYGAVGSTVNLATRIESFTLGGEILVCSDTLDDSGTGILVAESKDVRPKGYEDPIRIHRVVGVEGREDLRLTDERAELEDLARPVAVHVTPLDGKEITADYQVGSITALSRNAARLDCGEQIPAMSNLRLQILDAAGDSIPGACYGKVVQGNGPDGGSLHLRITARSNALEDLIRGLPSAPL